MALDSYLVLRIDFRFIIVFVIYINDLCNVSKALDFILFADDTNIIFFS